MARIIAIVNQKGGVGKTTTAVNLGAYLARQGKFVLLVDLDPQSNASSGLGLDRKKVDNGIYDALSGTISLKEVLASTNHDGFKLAPATPGLAGARIELVDVDNREFRLHKTLMELRNDYDFIIIDCPPSLDLLTVNGLVAADEVLVPVQAEYYALEGLGQLLETVDLVKTNLKPSLRILGAVLTMYDKRNKLSTQILGELATHFPHHVFSTVIPRSVRLTEAPSFGQSILQFDPTSKGARAYQQLADEVVGYEPESALVGLAEIEPDQLMEEVVEDMSQPDSVDQVEVVVEDPVEVYERDNFQSLV